MELLGGWLRSLPRRPGPAFLLLFALGLSVRGFVLTKLPEEAIRPDTRWEAPAIAVALAERGAFADAYALPTGPTAHLPPVPIALTALCYRIVGTTLAGGYAAWAIEAAVDAAVWASLPWVALSAGLGGGAGLAAGAVGAFVPRWSGHGEALAALAIALLMVAFLARWRSGPTSRGASLLLGLGAGVSFHVQPALLPVVLGWLAVEWRWGGVRRKGAHSALLALGMVLACLPWAWRNLQSLDAVFFVRSNFGLELRMGNHEGAAAAMDAMDRLGEHRHPRAQVEEARRVQELGEVAYMREAGHEAWGWIRENPGRFAELTLSRIAHWWLGPFYHPPGAVLVTALTLLAGLGAWRALPGLTPPQRAALLVPLFLFPLVYYVVAYMPRYREPVDWIFLLLAGAAVVPRPTAPMPSAAAAPVPPVPAGTPGTGG
jgi:hypothetical protein